MTRKYVDFEGAVPQKSNDTASDKSICITHIQAALQNAFNGRCVLRSEGGRGTGTRRRGVIAECLR